MILIGQYIFELMEQFWLVSDDSWVMTQNNWSIRAIYSGEMDKRDKGIMHQTLCLHIWIFDESYVSHDLWLIGVTHNLWIITVRSSVVLEKTDSLLAAD